MLRRARTEDLSEVSGIGCLYQSGVDRLGRPVVVFVGKWFPFNKINLEKVININFIHVRCVFNQIYILGFIVFDIIVGSDRERRLRDSIFPHVNVEQ